MTNRKDNAEANLGEIPERWKGIDVNSISDSEIEELIEDVYRTKQDINLPLPLHTSEVAEIFKKFNCQRCGDCCIRGSQGILLYPEDVERLASSIKMSKNQFKNKFTFTDGGERFLPFPCPFYDLNNHTCTVYEVRPSNCQSFPFYASLNQKKAKFLYPSDSGVVMVTIAGRCPEGRRIACDFFKRRIIPLLTIKR